MDRKSSRVSLFEESAWELSGGFDTIDVIHSETKENAFAQTEGPLSAHGEKIMDTNLSGRSPPHGGTSALLEVSDDTTITGLDCPGDFVDQYGVRWIGDCRILELMMLGPRARSHLVQSPSQLDPEFLQPVGASEPAENATAPGLVNFEKALSCCTFDGVHEILHDGHDDRDQHQQRSLVSFEKSQQKAGCLPVCPPEDCMSAKTVPWRSCSSLYSLETEGSCVEVPDTTSTLEFEEAVRSVYDISPASSSIRSTPTSFCMHDVCEYETACSEEGDRIVQFDNMHDADDVWAPESSVSFGIQDPSYEPGWQERDGSHGNLGDICAFSNSTDAVENEGNCSSPKPLIGDAPAYDAQESKCQNCDAFTDYASILDKHGVRWQGDCGLFIKPVGGDRCSSATFHGGISQTNQLDIANNPNLLGDMPSSAYHSDVPCRVAQMDCTTPQKAVLTHREVLKGCGQHRHMLYGQCSTWLRCVLRDRWDGAVVRDGTLKSTVLGLSRDGCGRGSCADHEFLVTTPEELELISGVSGSNINALSPDSHGSTFNNVWAMWNRKQLCWDGVACLLTSAAHSVVYLGHTVSMGYRMVGTWIRNRDFWGALGTVYLQHLGLRSGCPKENGT